MFFEDSPARGLPRGLARAPTLTLHLGDFQGFHSRDFEPENANFLNLDGLNPNQSLGVWFTNKNHHKRVFKNHHKHNFNFDFNE